MQLSIPILAALLASSTYSVAAPSAEPGRVVALSDATGTSVGFISRPDSPLHRRQGMCNISVCAGIYEKCWNNNCDSVSGAEW